MKPSGRCCLCRLFYGVFSWDWELLFIIFVIMMETSATQSGLKKENFFALGGIFSGRSALHAGLRDPSDLVGETISPDWICWNVFIKRSTSF